MLCDKDNVPLKIGDTVTKDGYLFVIREIVVYELAVELVCEDKLSRIYTSLQPRDVMKI
jgi:hypothetical protein